MTFNQSAAVSEVLNVLETAAREDNFDEFKVDPNSIDEISAPTTGTSSTKSTVSCFYFQLLLLSALLNYTQTFYFFLPTLVSHAARHSFQICIQSSRCEVKRCNNCLNSLYDQCLIIFCFYPLN